MIDKKKRFQVTSVILVIVLAAVCVVCLCWGTYRISVPQVLHTLIGQGSKMENTAILQIRLPRLLVGMLVGIALSFAGNILQTITKNDLADSGIIGINAGAAVAAVMFISWQTADYYSELGRMSIYVLPLMAILGATFAAFLIYALSSQGGIRPKRLLLIGISVNAGLNALITFITFKGGVGDYNRVLIWTSGSLWGAGWSYVKVLAPLVFVVVLYVLWNHKKMDVLNFSDDLAVGLGLNVKRQQKKLLVCAVLLAGGATAFAGNIGFLGLLAPHMARKLVGANHKYSLIAGAAISMIMILSADVLSRNLFSPIEIPVGICVSILGVPYFIYLLIKE